MQLKQKNIKAYTLPELEEMLTGLGLKKYRAGQIIDWIYRHHARGFEEMTNIAKADRDFLTQRFPDRSPQPSQDRSVLGRHQKVPFRAGGWPHDRKRADPGRGPARRSASRPRSAVPQACRFCLTGSGGFQRNLKAFEIADQVLAVDGMLATETAGSAAEWTRRITNIVLMGMGEPLANFDEVMKALLAITSERGWDFRRGA